MDDLEQEISCDEYLDFELACLDSMRTQGSLQDGGESSPAPRQTGLLPH